MKMQKLFAGVAVVILGSSLVAEAQTIMPNAPGMGWNVYGGGPIRQIIPNAPGMGWIVRGISSENALFESADFKKRFSEESWVSAVANRDVPAMTSLAWSLKGIESILGSVDKKTSSANMFDAAAQVAVEQGDKDALKDIVALCPACKSYQDDIKATGKSRGLAGAVVTMPQLLPAPILPKDIMLPEVKNIVEKYVGQLQSWQTPILTPDLVRFNFRGMSTPEAENVAMMANRGRQTGNPGMLAQAAACLAGQKAEGGLRFLDVDRMVEEAAGLAIILKDRKALSQVIDYYETDALGMKSDEKAKALADELKLMGASRGASDDDLSKKHNLLIPRYVLIFDHGMPAELTPGCVPLK